MRRAAKIDRNQPEIVAALRKAGASVELLHTVGKGCPDLLVGYRGANYLLEVKDGAAVPSARKLNDAQAEWHETWRGRVCKVETVKQALAAIGVTTPLPRLIANDVVTKALIEVAQETGMMPEDIMAKCKEQDRCVARWAVMRKARDAGLSLPAIGRAMGLDHSTIVHGLARLEEVMK